MSVFWYKLLQNYVYSYTAIYKYILFFAEMWSINSAYKDLGKCKTLKFTSGNSAQIIALYFLRTLEFLGMFHWLTRRTILVCLSASFLSVVQTGYFLLLHLRVHQFFPLLSPSIVFLILVVAFSVPKMPFGSSLHFLFICQDFRLFIYCKCVHNCCWSIFTTAPLKFLLHNSNVGFVSVLVCVSCLFSLKLRLLWFLVCTVIFHCILDVWAILFWDSASYFSLF